MISYPKVSILMANYNREDYIKEAIDSVLLQTYSNYELFIIDDQSTDDSWNIITDYIAKNKRIKAYKNPVNMGVGYTKKRLLNIANGSILFIVDSDDKITDNAVELLVEEHLKFPKAGLIYSDHYMCNSELKPIDRKSISRQIPEKESHLTYHGIGHLVSLKKSFYKKIDGLNENLTIAVDQDLFYQMEEVGNIRFLNEKLYYYRMNDKSISLNKNRFDAALQKVKLMREAKQRRIKNKSGLKLPSEDFLNLLDWYAKNNLGRGNIIKAYSYLIKKLDLKKMILILLYHIKGKL